MVRHVTAKHPGTPQAIFFLQKENRNTSNRMNVSKLSASNLQRLNVDCKPTAAQLALYSTNTGSSSNSDRETDSPSYFNGIRNYAAAMLLANGGNVGGVPDPTTHAMMGTLGGSDGGASLQDIQQDWHTQLSLHLINNSRMHQNMMNILPPNAFNNQNQ